ncbi:hypothetical protein B0H19DRAFT_1072827 [Mycena capillaripes]|nr:hypothetical protein B0H19DRAFT_1072827 [Mycena capillaripes]
MHGAVDFVVVLSAAGGASRIQKARPRTSPSRRRRLAASADALPAFMAQSNTRQSSIARSHTRSRDGAAAAYRDIHDLVVLAHGVLCHRRRQHAGPAFLAASGGRTLPASLAPLLPSFGHGSRLASSTAASSSTLALRTFNASSSSHALSAYPASDTPTLGSIPLRAAEVGRRVQIPGVRADDDVARVAPPLGPFTGLPYSSSAFEGLFHEESGGGVSAAASGRARLPDPRAVVGLTRNWLGVGEAALTFPTPRRTPTTQPQHYRAPRSDTVTSARCSHTSRALKGRLRNWAAVRAAATRGAPASSTSIVSRLWSALAPDPAVTQWEEPEKVPYSRVRRVVLPQARLRRIMVIASTANARDLKDGGLLLDREDVTDIDAAPSTAKARYVVETLLIPTQHAPRNTLTEERGFITLGWAVLRLLAYARELPAHVPGVAPKADPSIRASVYSAHRPVTSKRSVRDALRNSA